MRYLYTALFYLAIPFILLRLLWKARKNPAYLQRWSERFGCADKAIPAGGIWVHAVSVGEVIAAVPLIKELQQRYTDLPIIVTTMTPTGAERVKAALADTVIHHYVPYDLPDANKRFLNKIRPKILIIIETELWPNLLQNCYQRQIPIIVINARLSERSAKGYQRFGQLTRTLLNQVNLIAAQNAVDGERFLKLGLAKERLRVTGSIKFDLELPADLLQRAKTLRATWDSSRPVWIAASTHEGEEEVILAAHAEILKRLPQSLLIIVPRHPERFSRVISLCRKQNYLVALRSEAASCSAATQIFVGDTMGELLLFYACADVAFVGGSLVEKGGHNPLEPVAIGVPVITGPHVFNFAIIHQQLQEAGALITVNDAEELAMQVVNILQNPVVHNRMCNHGRRVVDQNKGALARQLELVEGLLKG